MTVLDRVRRTIGPDRPEHPVEIQADELEELSAVRGIRYWRHARWGILRLHDTVPDDSSQVLPNLPFVTRFDTDARVMDVYAIVPDEAYQRLTSPRPEAARKPDRAVSALRGLWTFRRKPEVMIPGEGRRLTVEEALSPEAIVYAAANRGSTSAKLLPGKPRADTPEAMVAVLAAKGITLTTVPADDGPFVIAWAEAGRINDSEREALRRSRRLLAPHVAGHPAPDCEAPRCTNPATDVTWPDEVLVCDTHATPEGWR